MKKFTTILADPPWPYNAPNAVVGNGGRGSQNGKAKNIIQTNVLQHYNTMSIEDIKKLNIKELTETNAHLYLWTTNSFMVEAHEIAKAWGFNTKTIITWVKTKKGSNQPSMKTGYWFRSASEHVLFCVKGKLRLKSHKTYPTVFFHERLGHSVKPNSFYELIEDNSPPNYLELFARQIRNNWDAWGNQINSTIHIG